MVHVTEAVQFSLRNPQNLGILEQNYYGIFTGPFFVTQISKEKEQSSNARLFIAIIKNNQNRH